MKVYMAGPLFTAAEQRWNREIKKALEDFDYEVFLPQESTTNFSKKFDSQKIFEEDVKQLDDSDVIVAWIEGPDPDSGTCWEVGYAKARNKIVIAYTTDLRFQFADWGPHDLNLMLTYGVDFFLRDTPTVSPKHIVAEIKSFLIIKKVKG